jgi:hypothetical protein
MCESWPLIWLCAYLAKPHLIDFSLVRIKLRTSKNVWLSGIEPKTLTLVLSWRTLLCQSNYKIQVIWRDEKTSYAIVQQSG